MQLLDYPGPTPKLSDQLWRRAAQPNFPRKAIYDARLALTLRHFGVKQFATRNTKDFQDFGFERVWDPLVK